MAVGVLLGKEVAACSSESLKMGSGRMIGGLFSLLL
jgi:hypothetical protein